MLDAHSVKVIILEAMNIEITDAEAEKILERIIAFENPVYCAICSAYEEHPVYHP
jgi:hypothetical protein